MEQKQTPRSPVAKLMLAGLRALQEPAVIDAIAAASTSENKEEELAKIAKSLIDAMDDKANGGIPPDAIAEYALELVETLANLANAASDSGDETLGPKIMRNLLEESVNSAESVLSNAAQSGQEEM